MKESDVFIAIPCYNAENFIADAIYSVINQSWKDWNLIILDDGSTDRSLEIIETIAKNDERIKVFSDGTNKGLVYRLNQSVDLAPGKYYVRMDADDIMHPERLKTQISYLESHPEVDVIGSSIFSINESNDIKGWRGKSQIQKDATSFIHPTIAGKITWFKKWQYDSECERMEDSELWLRSHKYSNFVNLPNKLLFYREFGIPTIKKYSKSKIMTIKRIYLHPKKYNLSIGFSIMHIAKNYLQIVLAFVCSLIGLTNLIISMRPINSLTETERTQALKDLNNAISE